MSVNLTQNSQSQRILGLDGLRALSVLAVFFHHTGGTFIEGGYIGVELFFVLSGYLITKILCNERSASGRIDFVAFYIRRAKRLYPALIALLVAVAAYCFSFEKHDLWLETLPSLFYVVNWYRAFNWYDGVLTGHTWSLAIEEQFYLVWPLLLSAFIWLAPRRSYLLVLGLIAAIVIWRTSFFIDGAPLRRMYNGFDTHADAILIGAVLSLVSTNILRRIGTVWSVALIYILVVVFSKAAMEFSLSVYGFGSVAAASAALIAKVISDQESILVRVLNVKPLVWLGTVSYGFYLWHYPIIQIALYGGHDSILGFFGSLEYPIPMLVSAVFITTLFVTSASWYLVERPIIRSGHRPKGLLPVPT